MTKYTYDINGSHIEYGSSGYKDVEPSVFADKMLHPINCACIVCKPFNAAMLVKEARKSNSTQEDADTEDTMSDYQKGYDAGFSDGLDAERDAWLLKLVKLIQDA